MPIKLTPFDYAPLHNEVELEIFDEDKLAKYVAFLMLGNHLHVRQILNAKRNVILGSTNRLIDLAKAK